MCICVGCKNQKRYGLYCYKHKRYHLVKNNLIIFNKFTKKTNDYLKKDILNTLKKNNNINKINDIKGFKKEQLFDILVSEIEYINKIIKIQRCYLKSLYNTRGYLQNLDDSKNDLDFYTLEPIKKIGIKYFCSYMDKNNNLWCFDIRSFKQLLNSAKEKEVLNPYNRVEIPLKEKDKFIRLIEKLKIQNVNLEFKEEVVFSKEEELKRNIVDIFSEISRTGYYMDIKWFYELTNYGLKHLYKYLEDIWNYRAQLTVDTKKQISPPNGILYSYPVNHIFKINNKYKLRKIIISDLNKIYSNCLDNGSKSLGYMYFIIGLSFVNKKCYDAHSNWISFSI
tara:strand:+ start:1438 stop:2448 length:1011 start_codon:yes stop_codon:yes gene_type:complete